VGGLVVEWGAKGGEIGEKATADGQTVYDFIG